MCRVQVVLRCHLNEEVNRQFEVFISWQRSYPKWKLKIVHNQIYLLRPIKLGCISTLYWQERNTSGSHSTVFVTSCSMFYCFSPSFGGIIPHLSAFNTLQRPFAHLQCLWEIQNCWFPWSNLALVAVDWQPVKIIIA